jgi:homoserine dehydrogenase
VWRRLSIKSYNLCLLGFGNVNRTLVRLLRDRENELRDRHGIAWRLTGVASRRLGWIADPAGLNDSLLDDSQKYSAQASRHGGSQVASNVRDWLQAAHADVLFEATSLNVENGQPAIDHVRAALERGAHAITANKGPVVHAYKELSELAAKAGKCFLFESSVMDGVPIFALFRDTLPLVKLQAVRGILNSTTNVILSEMENGLSFETALAKAQALGVAETDASYDIDGWDAAVKVTALATVLMGVSLKPNQVKREGIRKLSAQAVRDARTAGTRYKLVCRLKRVGNNVEASVQPETLAMTDPLASVEGTSSIICFQTDIFPELVITENNPGLEATAYGMLADFVRATERDRVNAKQ